MTDTLLTLVTRSLRFLPEPPVTSNCSSTTCPPLVADVTVTAVGMPVTTLVPALAIADASSS